MLMGQAAESDGAAADRLLPLVYDRFRKPAQLEMAADWPDHTLSATALVHEPYVKLVGPREIGWMNRRHFYVAADNAMRQILLDHARARGRDKRGGDRRKVPLSVAVTVKRTRHHPGLRDAACGSTATMPSPAYRRMCVEPLGLSSGRPDLRLRLREGASAGDRHLKPLTNRGGNSIRYSHHSSRTNHEENGVRFGREGMGRGS